MNDDPVPPRELAGAPAIPAALEAVILRCLEKDPEQRYQSVTDLRDDLARATATVETLIHSHQPRRGRRATPKAPHGRSRRLLLMVGVGLAVALLAVGAFWIASGIGVDEVTDSLALGHNRSEPVAEDVQGEPAAGGGPPEQEPAAAAESTDWARVQLRSHPSGAEVYRAGEQTSLGTTPFDLRLSNIGEEITLVFKLAGYEDSEAQIVVEDNTVVGVQLESKSASAMALDQGEPRKSRARKRRTKKPRRRRRSPALRSNRPVERWTPAESGAKEKDPEADKPAKTKRQRTINPEDQVDPFDG
jgi:serine/threonine-protein kinase